MQVIKQVIYLFSVGLLLLTQACSSELTPEEFMVWAKNTDNGLRKLKAIKPYQFDVQLKPIAYDIIQNGKQNISQKAFEEMAILDEGLVHIDLELGLLNSTMDMLKYESKGLIDYKERLYYYSFHFQNDIYLEQEGEKIPCSIYHFERSFNLKGNRRFLLGFEVQDSSKPMTLVIDSELLNLGPVKIKLDNTQELPTIKWAS